MTYPMLAINEREKSATRYQGRVPGKRSASLRAPNMTHEFTYASAMTPERVAGLLKDPDGESDLVGTPVEMPQEREPVARSTGPEAA